MSIKRRTARFLVRIKKIVVPPRRSSSWNHACVNVMPRAEKLQGT